MFQAQQNNASLHTSQYHAELQAALNLNKNEAIVNCIRMILNSALNIDEKIELLKLNNKLDFTTELSLATKLGSYFEGILTGIQRLTALEREQFSTTISASLEQLINETKDNFMVKLLYAGFKTELNSVIASQIGDNMEIEDDNKITSTTGKRPRSEISLENNNNAPHKKRQIVLQKPQPVVQEKKPTPKVSYIPGPLKNEKTQFQNHFKSFIKLSDGVYTTDKIWNIKLNKLKEMLKTNETLIYVTVTRDKYDLFEFARFLQTSDLLEFCLSLKSFNDADNSDSRKNELMNSCIRDFLKEEITHSGFGEKSRPYLASSEYMAEKVLLLLKHGAMLELSDSKCYALMAKLQAETTPKSRELYEKLFDLKPDINVKNDNDETPYHFLLGHSNRLTLATVKFYLSQGADIAAKNKKGETAFDLFLAKPIYYYSHAKKKECLEEYEKILTYLLEVDTPFKEMNALQRTNLWSYIVRNDFINCLKAIFANRENHEHIPKRNCFDKNREADHLYNMMRGSIPNFDLSGVQIENHSSGATSLLHVASPKTLSYLLKNKIVDANVMDSKDRNSLAFLLEERLEAPNFEKRCYSLLRAGGQRLDDKMDAKIRGNFVAEKYAGFMQIFQNELTDKMKDLKVDGGYKIGFFEKWKVGNKDEDKTQNQLNWKNSYCEAHEIEHALKKTP